MANDDNINAIHAQTYKGYMCSTAFIMMDIVVAIPGTGYPSKKFLVLVMYQCMFRFFCWCYVLYMTIRYAILMIDIMFWAVYKGLYLKVKPISQ